MIESQILGEAVGIQRGNVIDKSETTVLPSLANGVITGRFKRGRQDKPFKVTKDNYRALLGHDPSNPSYLAVEDAFKRGVSELSIVRVGGVGGVGGQVGGGAGIKCVANFAQLLPPPYEPEVGADSFLTVSRNGGAFKTYTVNKPEDGEAFDENLFSSDGEKVIFFNYPYGATRLAASSPPAICGIDSEGMIITPDQGSISLMDLELYNIRDKLTPPYALTKQHNWLTFKPTEGASPEHDMFFSMVGGERGASTLTIHSCAVVEKYIDPNVCTPTYNDASVYNFNGNSDIVGAVHAKYRINNGAWQNYTDDQDNGYNPVGEFLTSIVYNDRRMVNVAGGGGDSAFSTGYHADDIYGASATSKYMQDQTGIVEIISHTIDFEVTQNNVNDLVYAIFGKDTTIKSCAIGTWAGY